MPNEDLLQLVIQYRTSQDKYTYFLLAVAASAVAFAVQKTSDLPLSWSENSLGLATLSWGLSFYCGCKNIIWLQTAYYANVSLIKLKRGTHPNQPEQPEAAEAAMEGLRSALDKNSDTATCFALWQFRFLITGAVLFLVWHIQLMAGR